MLPPFGSWLFFLMMIFFFFFALFSSFNLKFGLFPARCFKSLLSSQLQQAKTYCCFLVFL